MLAIEVPMVPAYQSSSTFGLVHASIRLRLRGGITPAGPVGGEAAQDYCGAFRHTQVLILYYFGDLKKWQIVIVFAG